MSNKTINSLLALLIIIGVALSCRMMDTLTGNESAATVGTLWPDVPAFAGATKTDLKLPLGARLMIRAAMNGRVSFISYTTTENAQAVQDFYSVERMKSNGWTETSKGCISDTEEKLSGGAVCFYSRKDGSKREGLAIVIAQDKKTKESDIFYARIDLTDDNVKPTP